MEFHPSRCRAGKAPAEPIDAMIRETRAYTVNPIAGALFLEIEL